MSGLLRFDSIEAEYADLRDAFGLLVVRRHRGEDVSLLEADYGRDRIAFEERLRGFAPVEDDPRLVASIRSTLGWMDELEPIEGLVGVVPQPEAPEDASLRRATIDAFGEAAATVRVGTETIDRLTVLSRLATDPDPDSRRATFEALAPIWRAVDGDGESDSPYRRLIRSSAARWARDGSPVEAAAASLGITPGTLAPMLRELLATWRRVLGAETIEPWDYRFVVGASERVLGERVPRDRLRRINDEHLRSLGAAPERLDVHYDISPRPGRPPIPTAFTIGADVARERSDGSWRASTPWVFATYAEGGLGNLEELLHESGHALHYAAIRTRPALFEPLVEDGGLVEGIADLLGWDVHEARFQARYLGSAAEPRERRLGRYGGVMLDVCWALFEIEMHEHPDRSPNETWSEITAEGLGIRPHPAWPWWAMRGQLVDAPGYMANYALSAMVAAALRARIRTVRGDWLREEGDPGWYEFVARKVLRFGAERPAGTVLTEFLGTPLTAEPLLEDLRFGVPD